MDETEALKGGCAAWTRGTVIPDEAGEVTVAQAESLYQDNPGDD